jgi:hypothetical protein
MPDGESTTICGFEQAETSLCLSPAVASGKYCNVHDGTVCDGCGRKAIKECPHTNDGGETYCRYFLCANCEHRIAAGHGPRITIRDAAYQELAAALAISLEDSAAKGLCTIPEGGADRLATKILNDFSLHVTMKILSGIAQAPGERS